MSAGSRPLVLCYHSLSDAWQDALAVPPAAFERQLRTLLQRGYRPATAEQVLHGSGPLLHVTFDDAFRSVSHALPVLKRLRIPATIFVCTACADGGRRLRVPELSTRSSGHEDELLTMDWDTVREASELGVEIGSHTETHPHLTRLSDAEVRRELADSRERLETELGRSCRYLAYPYGESDARVRAAARWAGYAAAYGLRASAKAPDLYGLPRVDVYRKDGPIRFALKTSPFRSVVVAARDARRARHAANGS
jgi:peptidoglycan/xylan/chitin deacetylase (PgdA/CDA1 family)